MKIKFDVTPTEFIIIKDILKKYLTKDCKAYVFGSRAKSSSLHGSDLDLALECKEEIEFKKLSKIKIDFEDSRLPYMVDVVDLQAVKGYFKEMIEKEIIEFPLGKLERVPELRFKEFSGEWEEQLFNNIFLFKTGKNIKQNEASPEFEIPCVRYGELYHMYNEVIYKVINKTNLNENELLFSDGDEILLPSAGEDPLDIGSASALTLKNIAIGRTINILKPKQANIYFNIFVSYYINQQLKRKISRLAKGSSISNVYNSDLKKLKINLPQKQEQQKIASFLTTVDKKIEQLTKKIELQEQYKKSVMGKIFKQEIRFKNDDGSEFEEWEEKKLGDIGKIITGKTPKTSNTDLWNGDILFITPTDIKDNKYQINTIRTVMETEKLQILPLGSIVYTCIASIGKMAITKKPSITNQQINSIIVNNLYIDEFIYYILLNLTPYIKSTKANNTLPIINKTEFSKFKIIIPPSQNEQTKIANFLSSLDKKIDSTKEQLEKTKEFKKGLLQRIFV